MTEPTMRKPGTTTTDSTDADRSSGRTYPGRAAFQLGHAHDAVEQLGRMLIQRGGARFYTTGPSRTFTAADRSACAAFQRAQGWTGPDADGYPGPTTWRLLVTGTGRDIAADQPVTSPVPGHVVTYPFGVTDRGYASGWHTGDDYAAPAGTPIVAVVGGRVIRADDGGAYGRWTLIAGDDGHTWLYAHQSRRAVVAGDTVVAGQVIGYVGSTGHTTGPHLHLEKSSGPNWSYAKVVRPRW